MGDSEHTRPGAAGASRSPVGASHYTALAPVYETRKLQIAYGIQFHKDESLDRTPQEYLDRFLELSDDLEKVSDSEYISHVQGVRFTIEETTSKTQFINWLKTPDVHVIYMGHARYGRGPCFGAHGIDPANPTRLLKTEDWEQGSNAASGIFRLGYPFIGVEASEIIQHGYTARLVKESEGRPARGDCDPELRGYLGSLRARAPEDVSPGLASQLRDHHAGDRYWTYRGARGLSVIHHAGWRATFSPGSDLGCLHDPDDIDHTQMRCRAFTHLGCSIYIHNYRVVRRLARWQRDGNERYAYWTTGPSYPHAVGPWVRALIAYNRWNAFLPWGPSLRWAVQRTRRSLRSLGAYYRLI